MKADIHHKLLDCIERADRYGANRLLDEWSAVHGYQKLLVEVAAPVLRNVGEMWQDAEDFSLAQAYVASKIVEDILEKYGQTLNQTFDGKPSKGPVVIGNIEEDLHGMGRKIVKSFLKADGWQVHDLGVDVEPARFIKEAQKNHARVIGISAMMYTAAEHIREVRHEMDRTGLSGNVPLAVGGAVFRLRPELAMELGADGFAVNAFEACDLFEGLLNRSEKGEL